MADQQWSHSLEKTLKVPSRAFVKIKLTLDCFGFFIFKVTIHDLDIGISEALNAKSLPENLLSSAADK